MCNEQLFGSVQYVFLFYVRKRKHSTVNTARNTRLWHSLPSAQLYACEHTQNVKNVLLGIPRSHSLQKVLWGFGLVGFFVFVLFCFF